MNLPSTQPSLKQTASFCVCGHGESVHVGQHFDCDPVHICTECDCRRFQSYTAESLLNEAAELQARFWSKLSDLETFLDIEIDSSKDLSEYTVEELTDCD